MNENIKRNFHPKIAKTPKSRKVRLTAVRTSEEGNQPVKPLHARHVANEEEASPCSRRLNTGSQPQFHLTPVCERRVCMMREAIMGDRQLRSGTRSATTAAGASRQNHRTVDDTTRRGNGGLYRTVDAPGESPDHGAAKARSKDAAPAPATGPADTDVLKRFLSSTTTEKPSAHLHPLSPSPGKGKQHKALTRGASLGAASGFPHAFPTNPSR